MKGVYGMQGLIDICRGYEVEVELIQPYHARASYFGELLFDFFPKKCRFYNLQENEFKNSWHSLNVSNWKDDINRILSTFLWTKKIYPIKEESDLHGGVWEDVKTEIKERNKQPHIPYNNKYNLRSNPLQQD